MMTREVITDAKVQREAQARMAELLSMVADATPEELEELQAEYAALDGSWITERMVEMPDVVTPEAQAAVDAASKAKTDAETANSSNMDSNADQALANLRAFRDKPNAQITQGDVVAIVKVVCRVLIALIRFRLNKLEGTD